MGSRNLEICRRVFKFAGSQSAENGKPVGSSRPRSWAGDLDVEEPLWLTTPNKQLREADAAVDKAVADFISKIETMSGRWDGVAPAYILESVLLALCEEMTRLIDDPDLANVMGEAMLKLSDALADYRGLREKRISEPQATPGVPPMRYFCRTKGDTSRRSPNLGRTS